MIYFTSDTHFGHANVIKYCERPFKDIQTMNQNIINNWNSVIKSDDEVYHLGDFAFKCDKILLEQIMLQLNGKIYLIQGNHDYHETLKVNAKIKRFEWVKDLFQLKVDDDEMDEGFQRLVLCHYPFITWPHSSYGSWNLFGHVHGKKVTTNPKQLDVGVDSNAFKPISYEQVKVLITSRNLKNTVL